MITLPTEFTSGEGGYSQAPGPLKYTMVARTGLVAVYQRFFADGTEKDFETVVLRIIPRGTSIFNAPPSIDDEERYAVTSSWGKNGWTFKDKDAAMKKFQELVTQGIADDAEEVATAFTEAVDGVKYFTVTQFSEKNGLSYVDARAKVLALIEEKKVAYVGEKQLNPKGKKSKIYSFNV
jgi:hypothetical protein